MTKQEYMNQLTEKLSVFDEALAKEIIDDYEGHFRESGEGGKSEEQICEELGSIDEIIQELRELYEPKKKEESGFQDTVNEVVNEALHLANNVADTIVKGIKTGIDFGKRTWYEKTKEDVVDAECTGEKIVNCKKAFIEAGCANVEVELSDNEEFQLEYINKGSLKDKILYHFHGEQKGESFYGRLMREQGNSSLFQMLKTPEIQINIKVPPTFELLEINTSSGNIHLRDVQVKEMNVTTLSGDIAADELKAERNVMESASGDVTISNAEGKVIKLKSKSGDLTLNCGIYDEAAYRSKSGDVKGLENHIARLSVEMSSGDVLFEKLTSDSSNINSKSGAVSINDSIVKDLTVSTDSGDIHFDQVMVERIDAGSESGDIEINAKTKEYAVKNSSGAIKLRAEEEMNGKFSSNSGDIEIELIDGKDGYTADLNVVSGNVALYFDNGSKYGMHKGIYSMGEGKSAMAVNNVSGDVVIRA